MVEMEMIH